VGLQHPCARRDGRNFKFKLDEAKLNLAALPPAISIASLPTALSGEAVFLLE
jgi:hypothetical protein